ncbi:hypothetical protein [Hydrogenimonas sp. SS33]|uniref:hypothetical protein n=1 Tax=Hydrogenimonas leucolamina TaxID=2954236 RepID=UPI00336BC98D
MKRCFLLAPLAAMALQAADVEKPRALLPLCNALGVGQKVELKTTFPSLPDHVLNTLSLLGCRATPDKQSVTLEKNAQSRLDIDKALTRAFSRLLSPESTPREAQSITARILDLLTAKNPSEKTMQKMIETWLPMARIKYRGHEDLTKKLETIRRAIRPADLGWG